MSDQPCEQCGQWDWHLLHTGKNSATGEVEGPIDHAPVHTPEGAAVLGDDWEQVTHDQLRDDDLVRTMVNVHSTDPPLLYWRRVRHTAEVTAVPDPTPTA